MQLQVLAEVLFISGQRSLVEGTKVAGLASQRFPHSSVEMSGDWNPNPWALPCQSVCVCVCAQSLSRVWLFATLCTVSLQSPLSMEFSRQKYWSGLLFPPPGDLPSPGLEPESPVSSALAGRFFTPAPLGKPTSMSEFPTIPRCLHTQIRHGTCLLGKLLCCNVSDILVSEVEPYKAFSSLFYSALIG